MYYLKKCSWTTQWWWLSYATPNHSRENWHDLDCFSHTVYTHLFLPFNKHPLWPVEERSGKMLCQGQIDQWIDSSFILWCTEEVKRHLLFPIPPVFEFPNQHLSSEEGPSSEGLPYEKCCLGSFYLGSGRPRLHEQISGFKGMNWTHSRKKLQKNTHHHHHHHLTTVSRSLFVSVCIQKYIETNWVQSQ